MKFSFFQSKKKESTKQKVVCVWIGTFTSEDYLHEEYLSMDFSDGDFEDDDFDDDDMNSQFGKDAGLEFYDIDFMESWWFENLNIQNITADREHLLDAEYFIDGLIDVLNNRNLDGKNTIIFMFGEKGTHPANEALFNYGGLPSNNAPIEFVFKKEYATSSQFVN